VLDGLLLVISTADPFKFSSIYFAGDTTCRIVHFKYWWDFSHEFFDQLRVARVRPDIQDTHFVWVALEVVVKELSVGRFHDEYQLCPINDSLRESSAFGGGCYSSRSRFPFALPVVEKLLSSRASIKIR